MENFKNALISVWNVPHFDQLKLSFSPKFCPQFQSTFCLRYAAVFRPIELYNARFTGTSHGVASAISNVIC